MEKNNHLFTMRHSLAHILASAVQRLWPEAKFGVGPVVDNGFYYDIDIPGVTISTDDFKRIQNEMRKLINENQPFERIEKPIDEAIEWAQSSKQPYKEELLNDLKRSGTTAVKDLDSEELGIASKEGSAIDTVSFYKNGDFIDLCRGPHIENTKEIGAFKLMRVAGAYWRGKETNPQMQRIYGIAFETKEDLNKHLQLLEEAKKRDHRKLGKELDLFAFSDLVGPGLPLYTPRGTVIIEELKNALKDISKQYNMLPVSIPHLAKLELYEKSGHAAKFSEELFHVKSHYDQEFILKPVNCPHHTQIFASRPRSYRDLPLRYIEQTMQYRDEKPGAIGGLQRTRGFTVDDGHTFCRPDQIEDEASIIVEVIQQFYKNLGLWGEHWVSLSVRDPSTPEKYIGDAKDWDQAEEMLASVAKKYDLDAKRIEGEAAIYGPKIDFMFKDALGRETQLATIQLDFAMPKRFELVYTDQDGTEKPPVMIHRAILGSFERFIMLLIEHFAGRFPVWLAPEQLRIIQVKDSPEIDAFVDDIYQKASFANIRVQLDRSNESVGKKIRNAEMMKVPYTIVVGEKELETKQLSPRLGGDHASDVVQDYSVSDFIERIVSEAKTRTSHFS